MAMPGVKLEFKQLTSPGPPATQYLLVHFSRCNLIQPMTSRRDFWPRGKCRIGQNAEVRAPKKLTSDFCSEILMIESIKQSLNFNNMKKKNGAEIASHVHFKTKSFMLPVLGDSSVRKHEILIGHSRQIVGHKMFAPNGILPR